MATIKDIARITGYSMASVSRALNNRPRISKEAREKILAVARELNYVPNTQAVSLVTGRSHNIGVMIPYTRANPYYDALITSIIAECFALHLRPTFLPTNYDRDTERRYLKLLEGKTFDGMIITSASMPYQNICPSLSYTPIVACENTDSSGVPFVVTDRQGGYNQMAQYALTQNVHCIGATFSRTPHSGIGAQTAFNVLATYFPKFSEDYAYSHCQNYADGQSAGRYFIRLDKKIDAIFANSDEIGAGIITTYQNESMKPPLIIGQNVSPIGEYLRLPSLDFHLEQIGKLAVQKCNNGDRTNSLIKSELVLRND